MLRRGVFCATLLLAPRASSAWTPATSSNGQAIQRPVSAVPVSLSDADLAWTRAALAWSSVTRAAFAPVEAAAPATPDPRDGVASAYDVPTVTEWRALVGDESIVAFTLLTVDTAQPCTDACPLVDADVVVNTAAWRFSTNGARDAFDREAVLVHELGHVLGLGHTCIGEAEAAACASVMAPVVTPGPGLLRLPGDDDTAGAAAWLPSGDVVRVSAAPGDPRVLSGLARWRAWRGETPGPWTDGRGLGPTRVSVTVDTDFVEAWSVTGHGAALTFELPEAMDAAATSLDAANAGTADPAPAREPASGCFVGPWAPSPHFIVLLLGPLLVCRPAKRRLR